MDALSNVLHVLRLSGAVFIDAEFTAPWCVTSSSGQPAADSEHILFFHWLISGHCKARLADGGATVELGPGDLLLMPSDSAHVIGSELSARSIAARTLIRPNADEALLRIQHGGGGESTRFVCGFLACDKRLCRPLLDTLPGMLRIPLGDDPTSAWFKSLLRVGAEETQGRRPGGSSVLARLSELLFVEAMRRYIDAMPAGQTGWLAGLKDRYVGKALALMHQDCVTSWTVEALASEVGLSRSALAQRFSELLGHPPMQYLKRWRLTVAAQRLRDQDENMASIGAQIGYDSEAAFNRAFRREFGMPPAQWRRTQGIT